MDKIHTHMHTYILVCFIYIIFIYILVLYIYIYIYTYIYSLLWWLNGKESVGDSSSILGWGKYPGEGNGPLLQFSCLENSTDRGAWWDNRVRQD